MPRSIDILSRGTRCTDVFLIACRERTVGGIEWLEDGRISYEPDFFGKPAYLTVSGQLQAEYTACALFSTYSFGPTFRSISPSELLSRRALK